MLSRRFVRTARDVSERMLRRVVRRATASVDGDLRAAEHDRRGSAPPFPGASAGLLAAERRASELGAELLGFYHSHPDHPARPSQYDLDHAWPFFSYIIVSVRAGRPEAMTSWRLREDRSAFDPETLDHMPNTIHIPTPLRPFTDKKEPWRSAARTVGELLADLDDALRGTAQASLCRRRASCGTS